MFQAQNRETINSTWNAAVSFKIIMMTSVTRSHFTKQHQNCKTKTKIKTVVCKTKTKTKTKTYFLVSGRSCPKTDGLRPHHWYFYAQCPTNGHIVKLYLWSGIILVFWALPITQFQGNSLERLLGPYVGWKTLRFSTEIAIIVRISFELISCISYIFKMF